MTHYLNLRGYTWQKCLRTWWWRLLLMAGLLVVYWRGTPHELFVAVIVALAVGWGDNHLEQVRPLRLAGLAVELTTRMTQRRRFGTSSQRGCATMLTVGALGMLLHPHRVLSWLFLTVGLLITGILLWDWWSVGRKLPRL